MDEFGGAIFFTLALAILLLMFYGCATSNAKSNYEHMKFSKLHIYVAGDLSKLLQEHVSVGNDEMKMSEALEKRMQKYLSLSSIPLSEQKKFKDDIKALTSPYIGFERRCMVLTQEGDCCYYDSYNNYLLRQIGYDDTAESVATIIVPLGNDNYEYVPVALQAIR